MFSNDTPQWIWQHSHWPNFQWDSNLLSPSLRKASQLQGKLLGKQELITDKDSAITALDAQLQNILQSSAIEGENLNVESVRSSLAKRLGVPSTGLAKPTDQSEGVVNLHIDATMHYDDPLTIERLYQWHEYLFPNGGESRFRNNSIGVGQLRGEEPMQVVSGPEDKQKVHFQAPPRKGLEGQLDDFLEWINASTQGADTDPILRAAKAHFWFITLHPFDDGNGRLARAITDYVLAQGEHQSIRFYAMAASIMDNRKGYYRILESTQKGDLDITPWMAWFVKTLTQSLTAALELINVVLQKTRYWQIHAEDGLKPEQIKVLNRLLDASPEGFEGGLSATKYQSMVKVSKATATRHLQEMLEKKCIVKLEGGGRSTRYDICWAEG